MFSAVLALTFLGVTVSLSHVSVSAATTHESRGQQQYVTVTTKNGKVRGLSASIDGTLISTFYGMPYATPPMGSMRFRPPSNPSSWSGVRDALIPSKGCVQILPGKSEATGSEDCLYVNVHGPTKSSTDDLLPVMVWVHGGSYRNGQGAIYQGQRLATRGVLVVTFNYRLDAFGFLSTEDDVMPGNYGMLDQVAALKWVQLNIAAFGGDPKKVTVFGESAGSSSVSLLLLSPLTKGLYRGAIMESGTSLNPWAYAHPARAVTHRNASRLIGANVGCHASDSRLLFPCLQSVDAASLVKASKFVSDTTFRSSILMNPRVEQTFGFLPDLPIKLLQRGEFNKVTTIRGFNEDESGFFLKLAMLEKNATAETFIDNVEDTLKAVNISDKAKVAHDIIEYYVHDIPSKPLAYAQAIERFQTDLEFLEANAVELALVYNASKGNPKHYQYKFTVRPERSTQPEWVTAIHTDEIQFVFGFGWEIADPAHRAVMETIMAMWTNFAKTGDPNNNGERNGNNSSPSIANGGIGVERVRTQKAHETLISELRGEKSFNVRSVDANRGESIAKGVNPEKSTQSVGEVNIMWKPYDHKTRSMLVFRESGASLDTFDQQGKAVAYLCLLTLIDKLDDLTCAI